MNPASEKDDSFWRDFYYEDALERYREGDIEGAPASAKSGASYAESIFLSLCDVDSTEVLGGISPYSKTKPLTGEIADK